MLSETTNKDSDLSKRYLIELQEEEKNQLLEQYTDQKRNHNVCVAGHVDSGKSTFSGHLLLQLGLISQHQLDKFEKESSAIGKASFKFAWFLDLCTAERQRGITIENTVKEANTANRKITLVDTPGHSNFIDAAVEGYNQADIAILMVPAGEGEVDNTKQHIFLLRVSAMQKIIVFINKMDSVDYKENIFLNTKKEVLEELLKVGFKETQITFIPGSAFLGDNIKTIDKKKYSWYQGRSVIDELDCISLPLSEEEKYGTKILPVFDRYNVTGIGTVFVSKIANGFIRKGTKLRVLPGQNIVEIKSIEMHNKEIIFGKKGDNIGFTVKTLPQKVPENSVFVGLESSISSVTTFVSRIKLFDTRSQSKKDQDINSAGEDNRAPHLTIGSQPMLLFTNCKIACKVKEIRAINQSGHNLVCPEEGFAIVKVNQVADIVFETTHGRSIVLDPKYKDITRFCIKLRETIGAGSVIAIE